MKKRDTVFALLLAGSALFCGTGLSGGRVKPDVQVDGIAVGGMSIRQAETLVRAQIARNLPPLEIQTPAGLIKVRDELSFTDDAHVLLSNARAGERLSVSYTRTWANMESDLESLCARYCKPSEDARVAFSNKGFIYTAERNGISCNYRKLVEDVTEALRTGDTVSLSCMQYPPAVTEKLLRARTKQLASYTTLFNGENKSRSHNIRLAAARISGTTLKSGETFSFNGVVGKRTEKNGFLRAAVIQNGAFTEGVGGGVCQASTTLYNAALLAGLKVTESRSHSLSVGYVPPSRDAMVSEYSDLKFVNPYRYPVYIRSKTEFGSVTFEVFGAPDGKEYKIESNVLLRIAPPPAKMIEGEKDGVIRAEKEGLKSESYLLIYDGAGKLLSKRLLRKDSYAAVQGVYEVVKKETDKEENAQTPTP